MELVFSKVLSELAGIIVLRVLVVLMVVLEVVMMVKMKTGMMEKVVSTAPMVD